MKYALYVLDGFIVILKCLAIMIPAFMCGGGHRMGNRQRTLLGFNTLDNCFFWSDRLVTNSGEERLTDEKFW